MNMSVDPSVNWSVGNVIFSGQLIVHDNFSRIQSNNNKPLITPKLDEADALAKQQEDTLVARYLMLRWLRSWFLLSLAILVSLIACDGYLHSLHPFFKGLTQFV